MSIFTVKNVLRSFATEKKLNEIRKKKIENNLPEVSVNKERLAFRFNYESICHTVENPLLKRFRYFVLGLPEMNGSFHCLVPNKRSL